MISWSASRSMPSGTREPTSKGVPTSVRIAKGVRRWSCLPGRPDVRFIAFPARRRCAKTQGVRPRAFSLRFRGSCQCLRVWLALCSTPARDVDKNGRRERAMIETFENPQAVRERVLGDHRALRHLLAVVTHEAARMLRGECAGRPALQR